MIRRLFFLAVVMVLLSLGTMRAQAQPLIDDSSSFVDAVTFGPGIILYAGALDNNPGDGLLQFLAQSQPSFMLIAERQVTPSTVLSAELSYDYLEGDRLFQGDAEPRGFTNNAVALNLVGAFEPGIWRDDFLRLFVGGGPMLLLNPTYRGFYQIDPEEKQELGTRVVGNVTAGLVIFRKLRVGVRIPLTNYSDGWRGGTGDLIVEQFFFVNFGFRLLSSE